MKGFIFLADGFEESEAIVPIDLLRRAGADLTTVSISEKRSVLSTHGIEILADKLFEECEFSDCDFLILPGGMPGTTNLNNCEKLKTLLKTHFSAGKTLAAICAAPMILGEIGALDGCEAVCYPGFEKYLRGAKIGDEKVVACKNIITARGAGCATEFGLKIIEKLFGTEKRDEIAKNIIY